MEKRKNGKMDKKEMQMEKMLKNTLISPRQG